jgi:hypothetical protein
MRRFRAKKGDSLDLLLDTMCNAFGGIVLIAILITLLTRDTRDRIEARATSADRELIEREILALQSDIAEANEYLERQATSISVDPNLVARLGEARGALQTAKGKNEEAWSAWQTASAKAAGHDPEADKVLGEKVSIASRISRLTTEADAQTEKLERLKLRLETLRRERSDIIAERSEQLRLPKERSKEGALSNFILFYDEVFPLYLFTDKGWQENREPLAWVDVTERTCAVTPQRGRGIAPSAVANQLKGTIAEMRKSGAYAAIYLTPESVKAYRALRGELLQAGVLFGWTVDERTTQRFGPDGTAPPPL